MKRCFFVPLTLLLVTALALSYVGAQPTPQVQGLLLSAVILQRGEVQIRVPTFKKDLSKPQMLAQIKELDRASEQVRGDKELKLSPGVRDGLKHWESMKPDEKLALLQGEEIDPRARRSTWARRAGRQRGIPTGSC